MSRMIHTKSVNMISNIFIYITILIFQ